MNKKIIILSESCASSGISNSAFYLRDYLKVKFDVRLIFINYPYNLFSIREDIEKSCNGEEFIILVHESMGLQIRHLKKYFNTKAYFFTPGAVLVEKKYHRQISDYNGIICSCVSMKKIAQKLNIDFFQWVYDLPLLKDAPLTDYNKRSDSILYVGRIMPQKISPSLISDILKMGLNLKLIGEYISLNAPSEQETKYILNNSLLSITQKLPKESVIKEMQKHKFFLLISELDNFSLATLEAIYQGCLPIVLKREGFDYSWATKHTKQKSNHEEVLSYIEDLFKLDTKKIQELAINHRNSVIQQISKLSSFDNLPF